MKIAVNFMWKVLAPLNVLLFDWRWIINRFPTRDQLLREMILIDDRDKCCALFFKDDESKQHVFSSCDFNSRICASIVTWIDPKLGLTEEHIFFVFVRVSEVEG